MLPAGKILSASIREIGTILGAIFAKFWYVLALPAVASYFLAISIQASGGAFGEGGSKSFFLWLLLSLAFWLFQVPVALSWIEKVVKKTPPILAVDVRFWPAMGYSLLIWFLIVAPIVLIFFVLITLGKEGGMNQYVAGWLAIIGSVVWWSMTLRFCLVAPAIALRNANTRLGRSWSLTKGYNLKLLLIFIPIAILIGITTGIVNHFSQAMMFDQVSAIIGGVLTGVVTMASTMLWAEIQGRLFVFFLAPQKINEYI